ncbi:MAG: hypothetical protein NT069_06390 [Planctomycetota bacterium]|nr:hypothetical protein [Planctomycetota bacterium]
MAVRCIAAECTTRDTVTHGTDAFNKNAGGVFLPKPDAELTGDLADLGNYLRDETGR